MITQARTVRIAIFDVDGVLSDGGLHYAETGDAMKTFDVRDGMGMKLLQDAGVTLAIITSRRAGSVRERAADLGIKHVQQGVADKFAAFEELLAETAIPHEHAAFLGDDLVDLPVLRRCGFAVTVADAPAVLKRHAHYVTRAIGGRGAAREFCEIILHSQGRLATQTARFLGSARH
jgi:3-deoxy-D-manno-octulosonate 8-phosphate phosphatase (KDO 8-P phosphatase)